MSVRALYELHEAFFVPHFEVKIRDQKLPDDIIQDVMQVTYRDTINDIDSFSMTINNWDASRNAFKYVGSADEKTPGVFDPGQKVEIFMGYLDDMRLMLKGEITALEPNFPAGGAPTLSVRGLNALHKYRRYKHSHSWNNTRDSDIAKEIGGQPVSKEQAGLGIRVDTNPASTEQEQKYVMMDNQYDIVFLLERAMRHNYDLVLVEATDTDDEHLTFAPSTARTTEAGYRLEWGKSLVSFRPTLTTHAQIGEVVVRGWDRRTNKLIEGKASLNDVKPGRAHDRIKEVAPAFEQRSEVVTNKPVHTTSEAKELARKILNDQLNQMVTCAISSVGLTGLRAGTNVEITGIGPRFSGSYYITDSEHVIGDGYRTTFNARLDVPT